MALRPSPSPSVGFCSVDLGGHAGGGLVSRLGGGRLRSQLVDPVALAPEGRQHLAVELARTSEFDRHRVNEVAVDDDFVVEVRSGREASLPEVADNLALRDVRAFRDSPAETGHVIVRGHVAIGVLDLDPTSVAGVPSRLDDDAVAGGED